MDVLVVARGFFWGAVLLWSLGVVILLVIVAGALLDHWQGKRIRQRLERERMERELDAPKKPVAWRDLEQAYQERRNRDAAALLGRLRRDGELGCDREAH